LEYYIRKGVETAGEMCGWNYRRKRLQDKF